MRKDLIDITLVIDRSGSMKLHQLETENGVNHFIEEQKKQVGDCVFSLVQFDTAYEFVYNGVPIKDVQTYRLVPRGYTALLDAVGRAINETGCRLEKMPEDQRPGLVVVVIVTDGQENASHEFTKSQIKEMIERQQNTYSWKFTFLGANQNAFLEARNLGIDLAAVANYTPGKEGQTFTSIVSNTNRMRSASLKGQRVMCQYTDAERKSMV